MKERKRLKKILRLTLWVFACLIFLFLMLHTPPLRNLVKGVLSRTAAKQVQGELEIGRLRYNLWRGEVDLEQVELNLSGVDVQADRIKASFFSGDGISLKVEHPQVVIRPQPAAPKAKGDAPSRFWTILQQINDVEIEDGRFELEGNSSGTKWIIGSLTLKRSHSADQPEEQRWSLNGDLQCSLGSGEPFPLKADAILMLEQDNLHIEKTRVEISHSSIEIQGVLYQLGPLKADLNGDFQVLSTDTRHFGLNLPLQGPVNGRFQFAVENSDLKSQIELESDSLIALDSGPWEVKARSSFDGRVFQVDSLILNGYGGFLESRGSVDLKSKEVNAQIRAYSLDPNSLLSVWTEIPVPIASQVEAEIQLSLNDWQINQAKAEGLIRLDSLQTEGLPLSGDVEFELEKGLLSLSSKAFRVINSQLSFSGKIEPDELSAKYNLQFPLSDLPQLSEILNTSFPKVPAAGSLNVSGEVAGDPQNISATARVMSKNLQINSMDFGLSAELELDHGDLLVKAADIVSGPGRIQIQGKIPLGEPSKNWNLSAELDSLSLPDFTEKLGLEISLGGTLNLQGTSKNPEWSADLHAPFHRKEQPSQQGKLSLKAQGSGNSINCEELKVDLGSATLLASGQYRRDTQNISGKISGFGFRLEELQPYVNLVNGLEGNIGLDADFQGTLFSPNARLVLDFDQLSFKGKPIPDMSFSVKTDGDIAELKGFANEQFLSGNCQLKDAFPLQLTVDLAALPIQDMLSAFPDLTEVDITSSQGVVQIALPLRNPLDIQYHAEIDSIEGAYTQREWSVEPFTIKGDVESLLLTGFSLRENQQSFELDGRIPLKTEGDIDLGLRGEAGLDLISQFIPQIELAGKARGDLHIKGTRKQPQVLGQALISDCQGRWRDFTWENLEARVSGSEDELRLDSFSMRFLDGRFEANGQLSLTDSGINSRVSYVFDHLDLGILLLGQETEIVPSLRVSGRGELAASEFALAAVTGSGKISNIEATRGELEVSLENPVDWRMEKGYFSHTATSIKGEGIDLTPSLEFFANKTTLEWNLKVKGSVSPALGAHFMDDSNVRLSGNTQVELDLRSQEGEISGQISTEGGRITVIDPALTVSQIQTQLLYQDQILRITEIKAEVGSGEVSISGQLMPDETATLPKAELSIKADNIPYIIADGIYSQFSGDLRLSGDSENYKLSGDLIIPRILVSRELDATSQSQSNLERELKSLEGGSTFTDRISLDLQAEVQELQVKNSSAELSASGALSITGSPSLPELNGSISVLRGGEVYIGRARVRIIEGRFSLSGFPENPPDISVNGATNIKGISIELNVNGRTDNLQTQLVAPNRSDLTQGDLAMLIMTGRTASEVGSDAGAIIVEELADDLGEMLQKRTGDTVYIDVAPDPSYFSSDEDPTTRFNLGTQVTQNLFVIYSTALNGEQQRGIINFDPNRPFWLRYIVEEDGRNILELNHRLEIELRPKRSRSLVEVEESRRIRSVTFEGESPLTEQELQKLSRLKPGKDFDYWNALKGADRIQKKLVKLGYRGAIVEFEERSSDSDQVEGVYFLKTGKRIQIVWSGDSLSGGFKKDIEALWDGRRPEDELPDILAKQTEYALRADRFYRAKVSAFVTKTEKETSVQLSVRKDAKGNKVHVQFEGNDSLADTILMEALPDPKTAEFFEKLDTQSGMIRRRIHLLYASHGFIRARAKKLQADYQAETQDFQVNIAIEEGPQAMIASVTLPEDAKEISEADEPGLGLEQGQPFQLDDYVNDRSVLRSFYSQQGFYQPRVTGMLKPVGNEIAVSFAVAKGPRARVGKIRKARPGRTRLSKIESTLTLKEGDLILPKEIARSRQRFLDTRTYRSVDIRPEESESGPHIRDLVVDLIEKPDIELNYGLRYTLPTHSTEEIRSSPEYSAFEVGGRLEFLNPFGYGRRFGVSGYIFGREQFVRLFAESESFFGYSIPTQVFLSHTWKPELLISGIQSRVNKITFQQYKRWRQNSKGTRWADKLRLQWNYSFRRIQLSSTASAQESTESQPVEPIETYRGSASLALLSDQRDSFVDPTRGFFGGISSEFARQWLGSDVSYNKFYVQAYLFVPLAEKIIWASGLRIGAIPGDNPFLILEDRFRSGGPYSVRGFPIYYLGPKNEKGEALGGQAVFVFNQELRFPLYKMLHGGIFYDTGNVFAFANQMSLKGLRHSAGAGLRFVLPFGPLRLDWAYVLDPKPGEDRYQIFFTIGHAF